MVPHGKALVFDFTLNEIHRRRADKVGNIFIFRKIINLGGAAQLHDLAIAHDRNAVRECHGFDLIMRHIDHGIFQLLVKTLNFDPQIHAQLRIKIGQRFIKQKYINIADQGAADRNTLALTTRKGARLAVQERFNLKDFSGSGHALFNLSLRELCVFQTKGQVPLNCHLRVKRIGLKHHPDAPVRWFGPSDVFTINEKLSIGDFQQTCNTVQQGGFTTARRPEQDKKFALCDVEV